MIFYDMTFSSVSEKIMFSIKYIYSKWSTWNVLLLLFSTNAPFCLLNCIYANSPEYVGGTAGLKPHSCL